MLQILAILALILLNVKHASNRPVYFSDLCTRCGPIGTTDTFTLLQPGDIDRMHKWRPKKYYFVYVLIRLTSLVCMYKIQKKCCLKARLVSLISTLTKEYFFGRHLCIRSIGCVRLTLFRNKNTWSDDLKRCIWRFEAARIIGYV